MSEDPPTEADRLLHAIDRARQEHAAHAVGCYPVVSGANGSPDCAECTRLQRRLDALYRAYANSLLAEESDQGRSSGS